MSNNNQSQAMAGDEAPSHDKTMARIREGMKRLGDLPIFSTSINKVRRISSDPNSDAMTIAKEVLKDANLSVKLLRLSNSAFYNRGVGKISVISRSVIMLGFETVRNLTLTLKLIESFQNASSSIEMTKMLVRAYLAAGFVRDIADKCGVKDVEESYVCALLHNLGEITVAYVLPDEFHRITELVQQEGLRPSAAEQAVLGTTISRISQDLATSWEFPSTVVSTMAPPPEKVSGALKNRVSFNRTVSSLAHQLLDNLYTENGGSEQLNETMQMMAKATGLNDDMVQNYLNNSFRNSCTLATEYGLSKNLLKPKLGDGEGTLRNKWARQFSYYASMNEESAANPEESTAETAAVSSNSAQDGMVSPAEGQTAHQDQAPVAAAQARVTSLPPAAAPPGEPSRQPGSPEPETVPINPELQLEMIQEITTLIASSARLSEVFVKVLDGLHRSAGFERVLLCLVTPDRRSYVGRLAAGSQRDVLKEYFSFTINPSSDLFSKTLMDGGELLVADTSADPWRNLLPADFVKAVKANNFIIAALRYQEKAVGFFYADCAVSGRVIGEADQKNLLQFVTQARLALRLCS